MGAIFNTQGTRTILHFLNVHYGPGPQFDQARANGEYNVLRDYATYPHSTVALTIFISMTIRYMPDGSNG